LGDINTETHLPGWGLDARLSPCSGKKKIVTKSKEVKTGWSSNLAESSKEGIAQRAVLPVMMMIYVTGRKVEL
jgi:hypothetical protein